MINQMAWVRENAENPASTARLWTKGDEGEWKRYSNRPLPSQGHKLNPEAEPFEPAHPRRSKPELVEFSFDWELSRVGHRSEYSTSLCILQAIRRRLCRSRD